MVEKLEVLSEFHNLNIFDAGPKNQFCKEMSDDCSYKGYFEKHLHIKN